MKVLNGFYDVQDNRHHNKKGTDYPRKGLEPSEERINDLVERGFIEAPAPKAEEVKEAEEPKEEKPKAKKGAKKDS